MSLPPPPPPSPQQPSSSPQPPSWPQPPAQGGPHPYHAGWQPSTRVERTGSPVAWLALAGAVVTAVGSCLEWGEIAGQSFTGLGGDDVGGAKDGVLTLGLGIIAGVLFVLGATLKNRVLHIVGTVLVGLAAAIALYDISDINSTADELGFDVTIGIGLWMVAIGAAVATVAGIIASIGTKKRTVPI